jgi:hypothetical protein
VKNEQMGSGMKFNLHPSNLKKLARAARLAKGVRLSLTGGELEDMEGGNIFKSVKKAVNKGAKSVGKSIQKEANRGIKDIEKGATKYVNEADKQARKYVNKGINEVEKNAKKYVTEKNIGKYALKGYNALNNELEKQGMPSIHGAILNEGLGYVPFVPQSVKDVASNYAEKRIDRAISKESERYGAGMIGRGVNPYLPSGMNGGAFNSAVAAQQKRASNAIHAQRAAMRGSGVKSGQKVFSDQHNVLRPGQAGFSGLSAAQAEKLTGGSFTINASRGGSFTVNASRYRR